MDVVALLYDIKSTRDAISEGQDLINNAKKLKERLKANIDKIKKAQNEIVFLKKISSDEIEKGAKQATKDFVEMCQLIKLNCK